jgi:thiol-disulfide isomerase/thioredoxin
MNIKMRTLLFLICLLSSIDITWAQDVKLLSLNQLENRLSAGKDTVFVVNFWATWCGPCVKEIPNFDKLQSVYQNSPLKVILISVDFKSKLEKVVAPFVKRNQIQSEVFLLNEQSEQDYIDRVSKQWSGSLPATLIINRQKSVRDFYEQEFTWEQLEKIYLNHH